jgi:hypothetical protein
MAQHPDYNSISYFSSFVNSVRKFFEKFTQSSHIFKKKKKKFQKSQENFEKTLAKAEKTWYNDSVET